MKEEIKTCQNCKNKFRIEPEDFLFYEKIKVPLPTFCPDCRFQRRMAFRNERTLYKRKCDLCGEIKVSNFSPAWQGPVYCPKCWWSDKWDAVSYSRDYDFNKPYSKEEYFEKLKEMGINKHSNIEKFKNLAREFWLKNPMKYISGHKNINVSGDYIYNSKNAVNCYVVDGAENVKYSQYLTVKPISDCYDYTEWGEGAELVYDSVNVGLGVNNLKFNSQS